MFDIDLLMAIAHGLGLPRADRLLEFFRETIEVHTYYVALWGRRSPIVGRV